MDTQEEVRIPMEPHTGLAHCTCCAPRQLLIPRDDVGTPGRWAVCVATGGWYENRGDGVFLNVPAPRQGEIVPAAPAPGVAAPRPTQWAGGDAIPVIVPGVRIDLSKESYA
jgi:hypothetical protein